ADHTGSVERARDGLAGCGAPGSHGDGDVTIVDWHAVDGDTAGWQVFIPSAAERHVQTRVRAVRVSEADSRERPGRHRPDDLARRPAADRVAGGERDGNRRVAGR